MKETRPSIQVGLPGGWEPPSSSEDLIGDNRSSVPLNTWSSLQEMRFVGSGSCLWSGFVAHALVVGVFSLWWEV